MKRRFNIFILLLMIVIVTSCGGMDKLPFRGSGFGGPQNSREARIAKTINHDPIVFVHGVYSSANAWGYARKFFLTNGYNVHELFAINFKDDAVFFISPEASELNRFIKNVLRYTGRKKVVLIAHSRGGMAARVFLKMFKGYRYVSKCILIASPNHGTNNTVDQDIIKPGTSFLKSLNEPDEVMPGVDYLSIKASSDEFFEGNTANSPNLKGAKNVIAAGTNHYNIVKSSSVMKMILKFISN